MSKENISNCPIGDDLSMLIATSTVLHRVFTFDKSLKAAVTYGLILTALMTGFITWHCIVDETLVHSVVFGNIPYILTQLLSLKMYPWLT